MVAVTETGETRGGGPKRAGSVHEDLQARILSGALAAGSRLPPERELAAEYEVTRNTLREAVRALEQERLVTVRQGQGVTVADFRRTGRLTLLAPFLMHGADPAERVQVLLDALAARAAVLELAIAVAVERAQPEDLARLEAAAAAQKAAFRQAEPLALGRGELAWMNALIDAAHSTTVRWIANSFIDVYEAIITQMPSLWVIDPGYETWLDEVLAAFRRGDAAGAAASLTDYFRRTDASLRAMLGRIVEGETRG
ncbi:MAG: FadR family transcriptional regulator [Deltaproteobacteria bacterium]|nr:FadR family transcriptional regulator [Deltaproteobacteria bacterium]MCB9786212.1 FadR family transcriptional regulator [Deltaproteobacteria bacterium]